LTTVREALQLSEQALAAGDLSRARFIFEQILQSVPQEPHALNGLGVIAYRSGRLDEAEDFHRRAIALLPDNPVFYNNLYLTYYQQERTAEAIQCCRRAIELDPNSPMLHSNLGIALRHAGQLEPAMASLRRALEIDPAYADAHYNLANALVESRQLDQAEREFRRAIELAPGDFESWNNLGALLQLTGRFDEAMEAFEAALREQPQSADVRHNRALLNLLRGDYAAAWGDYKFRLARRGVQAPPFGEPCWEGQPLEGRTILLWGEQGLGDIIQMIRYSAPLKQQGATVLVECRPILHPLLATASGIDRFVDTAAGQVAFDYYIPLLSLPGAMGTTLDTIPADIPYLSAEPERVERWRRELDSLGAFKVGIAWQGSLGFTGDYYRSIALAEFAPLAECAGVRLVSLQKGHGRQQLPPLAERLRIVDLGASLDEGTGAFVDTAAVMKNLDLVITSDTSIAHVAGALGVPVWVALQLAPNWRWHLDRPDCPWYPTMRLFRQSRFGDWSEVFGRIAAALASLSSEGRLR
jgi:Flp pilus assembly protein TadD